MQIQSALILGGAGFIGTHLARELTRIGSVRRIVSLDIARPWAPVPRVIYRAHDIRRPIHETIDGHFDIVFNLAAVHRTPGHPASEYYETNIAGALNCIAFCERNAINEIFFSSSISVYGPSENALDENTPVKPVSAYGGSKRLAEEVHLAWLGGDRGRRLRIVRPAVVFGEGENGNYTRLAHLLRRGLFAYPGRKDTRKAGGYVKELVRTMFFAIGRPERSYLYNFADRTCPTAEEICAAFQLEAGVRRPWGVVPMPLIMTAVAAFEGVGALGLRTPINRAMVSKLTHSTHVVPKRLIEDGYPFVYDLRSAIADWLACDASIRPPHLVPRPIAVPIFAPTEATPAMRARGS